MTHELAVFRARADNIGVLVHDSQTGATAAIDAPDEAAIAAELARTGWTLTDILITHKHSDHIEGIEGLKRRFPQARVVAPAAERDAVPMADVAVQEGERVKVGSLEGQVIATPGHTAGHIVYWFASISALFAGDTLFSLGCGRLFEATGSTMWHSLLKLRELPDDAQLFCGHDYTLSNARFALSVDPDNARLKALAGAAEEAVRAGRLTIPSLLGDEKAANPFLRADDAQIARAVGLEGHTPEEVFTALRALKDRF